MIDVTIVAAPGELDPSALGRLARQNVPHHLVICENGCANATAGWAPQRHPNVTVIRLASNVPDSVARNAAAAAGGGEILVNVGAAVWPTSSFLQRLTAPFAENPRLGSVAAVLLRPDGRHIDSAGLAGDRTLAAFPRLRGAPPARARTLQPVLLGPVGSAAAFRRSAWEEVGGLDEALPGALEDLDLALRLRVAGWDTLLAADALAVDGSAEREPRTLAAGPPEPAARAPRRRALCALQDLGAALRCRAERRLHHA